MVQGHVVDSADYVPAVCIEKAGYSITRKCARAYYASRNYGNAIILNSQLVNTRFAGL